MPHSCMPKKLCLFLWYTKKLCQLTLPKLCHSYGSFLWHTETEQTYHTGFTLFLCQQIDQKKWHRNGTLSYSPVVSKLRCPLFISAQLKFLKSRSRGQLWDGAYHSCSLTIKCSDFLLLHCKSIMSFYSKIQKFFPSFL